MHYQLASLLLELTEDFGVRDSRGVIINLKLTHKEMAALIGATRETVSFAILEDRKFKSSPSNVMPPEAEVLNGWIQNPDFDARERRGDVAATLIPSVGCPMGCNFCSTSAMFGGKGKCHHFYETGDELFEVMFDRYMKAIVDLDSISLMP